MNEDRQELEDRLIEEGSEQFDLANSAEIEGRRSVRTTVKLSPDAFDALGWLSDHWDLPQKEVVALALREVEKLLEAHDTSRVVEVAAGLPSSSERKRKTLVMNQDSRERLNRLAEEHDASRDGWLELAIGYVKAATEKRREKQVEKHKRFRGKIQAYLEEGHELEREMREELGSNDPVFEGFGLAITSLMNLVDQIESEIEGGEPIDTTYL